MGIQGGTRRASRDESSGYSSGFADHPGRETIRTAEMMTAMESFADTAVSGWGALMLLLLLAAGESLQGRVHVLSSLNKAPFKTIDFRHFRGPLKM